MSSYWPASASSLRIGGPTFSSPASVKPLHTGRSEQTSYRGPPGGVTDTLRRLLIQPARGDILGAEELNSLFAAVVAMLGREEALELPDKVVESMHCVIGRCFTEASSPLSSRHIGLRLITRLIECDYCDYGKRAECFYTMAERELQSTDHTSVILASQCIAHIARDGQDRDGGLVTAPLVDKSVVFALNWLGQQEGPLRIFAGCTLLKDIALEVPALLQSHFPDTIRRQRTDPPRDWETCLERVWGAAWSEREHDREAAVACYGACLEVASESETEYAALHERQVRKVMEGFRKGSEYAIQGTFLCLKELLQVSAQCQLRTAEEQPGLPAKRRTEHESQLHMALVQEVLDVGRQVENHTVNRSLSVEVLPKLARSFESVFGANYLDDSMERIAALHRAGINRVVSFSAMQELCDILGPRTMLQHRSDILTFVREALATQSCPGRHREAALRCLGSLVEMAPDEMESDLGDRAWHESIRRGPVTEAHFEVLSRIIRKIPSLRRDLGTVTRRMLDEALSCGLSNQHCAPSPRSTESSRSGMQEQAACTLALRMLGTQDLCAQMDEPVVRVMLKHRVLPLLNDADQAVRVACVGACGAMLKRLLQLPAAPSRPERNGGERLDGSPTRGSVAPQPVDAEIGEMLTRVADLCVVDDELSVRNSVLAVLEAAPEFDATLVGWSGGRDSTIDCLFMAYNDADAENRRHALHCLCRLARRQAVGMPSLMAGLERILAYLIEDLGSPHLAVRAQVVNAELLSLMVKNVPNVVLPRSYEIITQLRGSLTEAINQCSLPVPALLNLFAELNDLVEVHDTKSREVLVDFLPIILECFDDWRATRQPGCKLAAVHALIRVIRSTGLVIDFYEEHPHVLPVLLGCLQNKNDWNLQSAVMKLIGTIGAVDPLRAKNLSFWSEVDEQDFTGRSAGAARSLGSAVSAASEAKPSAQSSPAESASEKDTRRGLRRRLRVAMPAQAAPSPSTRRRTDLQAEMMKASLKQQEQHVLRLNWGLDKGTDVPVVLQLPMRSHPGVAEHFPAVALQSLLGIMSNSSLAHHHSRAIDAIRLVIRSLSQSQLECFSEYLLVPILKLLRRPAACDTHSKLFQLLVGLVTSLGPSIAPHCNKVVIMLKEYWESVLAEAGHMRNTPKPNAGRVSRTRQTTPFSMSPAGSSMAPSEEEDEFEDEDEAASAVRTDAGSALPEKAPLPFETLIRNLITLLESIGAVQDPAQMAQHAPWILQYLLRSMQADRTESNDLTQKCFGAFQALANIMQERLHVLLPVLLEPITRGDLQMSLRVKALITLSAVIDATKVKEHTARVLHPLLRLLRTYSEGEGILQQSSTFSHQIYDLTLRALRALVINVGPAFRRFVPLTLSAAQAVNVQDELLLRILTSLNEQGRLPPDVKRPEPRSLLQRTWQRADHDDGKVISCVLDMAAEQFNAEYFKRIIDKHMRVAANCIKICKVKGPACTVDFRFTELDPASVQRYCQRFMQLTSRSGRQLSGLAQDLRIVEVKEKVGAGEYINLQALRAAWSVSTRTRRRARDWEDWINRLSIELIRNCPSQPLRACFQVAQSHLPMARDLFSYVVVSCFQELDDGDKKEFLASMDQALSASNLPPFALHMILSLAEFMEEERYRSVYTTQAQSKQFKVSRESLQMKFGIGYADVKHSGGQTWVSVSRVQAGSAGARARVPEQAKVLKLNGQRIVNVKQLSELLADKLTITLDLQLPNAMQRVIAGTNPFFDIRVLAKVSMRKQLLAKALHYHEELFRDRLQTFRKSVADEDRSKSASGFIELCSALINTNTCLGLRDAANGILEFTKRHIEESLEQSAPDAAAADGHQDSFSRVAGRQLDSMLEGHGYEKLQWWSQAIKAYKAQAQQDTTQYNEYMAGIMRCYRQLGRWEQLIHEAKRVWNSFDNQSKRSIAGHAAQAAWILSAWSTFSEAPKDHWSFMQSAVQHMPQDGEESAERSFFEAILAVRNNDYAFAERHVTTTRRLLESRLSSLVGESYARSYNIIVWLQKVNSLEEVMEYKQGNDVKRTQLKEVWHKRMFGMQPAVEHWQDMLAIMALVLEQGVDLDADDLSLWLKFVSICRRCNRNSFAEATLLTLMGFSSARGNRSFHKEDNEQQTPTTVAITAHELIDKKVVGHVALSYFKHLYHCDVRERAYEELRCYVRETGVLRERSNKLKSDLDEKLEIRARREQKVRWDDRDAHTGDHGALGHYRSSSDGQLRSAAAEAKGAVRRSASAERLDLSDDELRRAIADTQRELDDVNARLIQMDLKDDDLVAKTHLALGDWCQEIHKDDFWEAPHRTEILYHFHQAVQLSDQSSRVWHRWGLMNYRVAFRAEDLSEPEEKPLSLEESRERKESHLVNALEGFFKALDYLDDESFCVPNLLRILTVWFRYGHLERIGSEIQQGIRSLKVSTWVYVLPQLVARVSFPRPSVRQQVQELLILLGTHFPHHIVYPLTVCAVHGDSSGRRKAAQEVLNRLSHGERGPIFEQAKMVSQELIRVAISWAEHWYNGIEEAAKLHTEETNPQEMKRTLLNLYPMLNEPRTATDHRFLKVFQSDLDSARRYLVGDKLNLAWERYKRIWEKLQDWINKQQELQLADVSPEFAQVDSFQVAVPGINHPDQPPIMIARVHSTIKVVQSKQKPKVIVIVGDDGKDYKFLVKGHEDLRQDERVMQLFGLINALFHKADDLYDLFIQRYPVVPLSDNVGLIGWLERTETIYHMISEYRKQRKIPVNLECAFIMSLGQLKHLESFYQLSHQQKHDLLASCLEKTPGDCLCRAFWARTATSEEWLEHRQNYVRTLAAMSMVGYILGLGDRHLNNMMLSQEGNVVHIDFGDCFEVALNRQRFPEQVPFRLTRLLVSAMEASGAEGTFRYTCERVMWSLRKNRDSLTSLLETFVYDPLINWRLLETVAPEEVEQAAQDLAAKEDKPEPQEDKKSARGDDATARATSAAAPEGIESEDERAQEAGVTEMHVPEMAEEPDTPTQRPEGSNLAADAAAAEAAEALRSSNSLSQGDERSAGVHFASEMVAQIQAREDSVGAPARASVAAKSVRFATQERARHSPECIACSGTGMVDKKQCPVCRGVTAVAAAPRDDKAIEGELVNEKAKQVVIRIREKLTGYDFMKRIRCDSNPPSPRGADGLQPPQEVIAESAAALGPSALTDFRVHGTQGLRFGHSYEGWAMQQQLGRYYDDDGAEPVSVAHRDTWWLLQAQPDAPGGGDGDGDGDQPQTKVERCTVPEQVRHLIAQATSVDNLCEMFMGWCPFW